MGADAAGSKGGIEVFFLLQRRQTPLAVSDDGRITASVEEARGVVEMESKQEVNVFVGKEIITIGSKGGVGIQGMWALKPMAM